MSLFDWYSKGRRLRGERAKRQHKSYGEQEQVDSDADADENAASNTMPHTMPLEPTEPPPQLPQPPPKLTSYVSSTLSNPTANPPTIITPKPSTNSSTSWYVYPPKLVYAESPKILFVPPRRFLSMVQLKIERGNKSRSLAKSFQAPTGGSNIGDIKTVVVTSYGVEDDVEVSEMGVRKRNEKQGIR